MTVLKHSLLPGFCLDYDAHPSNKDLCKVRSHFLICSVAFGMADGKARGSFSFSGFEL